MTALQTGLAATTRTLDQAHVLATYKRAPFVLVEGQGLTLTDADGRTYLDFTSGIAVMALGHAHPVIAAAVTDQISKLGHVSNLYHTQPQAELAARLCETSFADKVFFCNSGGEANEAAIKFARKYARTVHDLDKTDLVAFTGGFHGRTAGALALTAREQYQAPFRPLLPGVTIAPFNDIEAAAEAITDKTCAVFVEPIQGEGGVNPADADFLHGLRDLCDQHNALLVFDEIQSGMGRTGKLWAYEHYGVQPDILTTAKALGGGLPVGAALMTGAVADTIDIGDHGSTFAAGPVASRAAQVVLDHVTQPQNLEHITRMGDLLVDKLVALDSPHITSVRGKGLMIGIELDIEAGPVIEAAYDHGLMILTAGPNVLRLLPALIVSEAEIDQCLSILNQLLQG